MTLVKVYDDREVHYFSTKAKASNWLKCKPSNVQYYINYGKEFNGWKIEFTEDPNILNGDIDKALYFIG